MNNKNWVIHTSRKIFLLVFFIASMAGKAFGFEHPRYHIKASVDIKQKKVIAIEEVDFINNGSKPIRKVCFHIYPNRKYTDREKDFMRRYAGYFKINPYPDGFQSAGMEIKSVREGKKTVRFSIEGQDETLLTVFLSRPLEPRQKVTISIDFIVSIPHAYGRLGWHKEIVTMSRWYPILSVSKDNIWYNYPFYPFHRPFFSEAAYYKVELTIPESYVVIHSGSLKKQEIKKNQKVLAVETPLPIREFSLSASPDYQVKSQFFGQVKVNAFYLPGDERGAQMALESAMSLMEFYTQLFGPYPYREFHIAPVYLGYGGEQMSNIAFIDTRVFKLPKFLKRYLDFLIAHETGHQWFYNMVGIDEYTQIWLEEGVHSYFILQYLENKYGFDASVMELPKTLEWFLPNFSFRRARDFRYQIIARSGFDHPIVDKLSSFKEPSSIFSLTYGKGAWVTSMLRYVIGQEAFAKVFKRVFKEFRFKNLLIDDFIRICEEESQRDLHGFFKQWLYTQKRCDVAVEHVQGNEITLTNKQHITMPVDVEIKFSNGATKNLVWNADKPLEKIKVDSSGSIREVRLDSKKNLLDIDRTNNVWPRQVHVKIVPLYLGVYEIPVLLKEDAYNLIIGPEIANNGVGIKASFQKPYDQIFYTAADYNFSESLFKTRIGYELKNIFHSFLRFGFELFNTDDLDAGEDDLAGGKVYLRKELWPASYSLTSVNDHITLYWIRNRSLNPSSVSGLEDSRNISYLEKDESIIGTALHWERAGPYFDPERGYRVDIFGEHSGHFLGATQYFNRGGIDVSFYHALTSQTKMALRLKYAGGYPHDKNLFELGGIDGLRGFDRKTLRGSSITLASVEYRFPIINDLELYAFDHLIGLESIGGVVFLEAGENWRSDFGDSQLKKDAGLGLRFSVNLGSFLEKVTVRFDAAFPINESKEDAKFWFSVGQSF